MGRDIETVERHQNLWNFREGLLKLDDVLELPFSLTVFEGLKGAIIFSNSVIAGLDMHWIGRFLVNANRRPNAQALFVQCRKLTAVDALVLAERNSRRGEIV